MSPPARFAAVAVALLVLAWTSLRLTLILAPPVREAWSILAVSVGTDVLYARWSVASTGFYDRQLTSRFWLLRQEGEVIQARGMFGPATITDDGVVPDIEDQGPAPLSRHFANSWDARIGGSGAQLSAKLLGVDTACPPGVGTLHAIVGSTPSGGGGGYDGGALANGPAVLVHTRASGVTRGAALYVLGNGASLGIDPLATCPAWAVIGKESWSGPALPLPSTNQGEVSLGSWTVTWRATAVEATSPAYDHLLGAERWLAYVAGWPSPTLRIQRVGVRIRGPGFDEPRTGILLVRGTTI